MFSWISNEKERKKTTCISLGISVVYTETVKQYVCMRCIMKLFVCMFCTLYISKFNLTKRVINLIL